MHWYHNKYAMKLVNLSNVIKFICQYSIVILLWQVILEAQYAVNCNKWKWLQQLSNNSSKIDNEGSGNGDGNRAINAWIYYICNIFWMEQWNSSSWTATVRAKGSKKYEEKKNTLDLKSTASFRNRYHNNKA